MKKGWRIEDFGKVNDIHNGGTPKTAIKEYWDGEIFWITPKDLGKLEGIYITDTERKITDLGLKKSSAKVLPVNSIVLSSRAPIGHLAISNVPISTNQGCKGIVVDEKLNDVKYIFYFLKNSVKLLNDLGTGTTFKELSAKKLSEVQIPIPSLLEQQKIVEKLDTAFELIDQAKANIEKNIQNGKELFQSKLNDVFSQKAVGWKEIQLGDIGKVSMCKRIMKDQTLPEGDIPFYKIGTFGKEPNAFISKEIFNEYSTKYSYPKKGEILLSASGTIGRCVVFDGEPSFFQDSNIVWISNDEKLVLNEFLSQFYKICDWNPSKGATISRLYNSDLRRIKMSFPNIEEQRKLIPRFEKLEQQTELLQKKYKQKLSNLEELKKSILEKAFKGELINKSTL